VILALETSTTNCSVALFKDGKCFSHIEENAGYSHAENLSLFVDELLKLNNISKSNLKAIAVNKGPGSYTGLRIGVSTAKGLAFGLNIPLLSFESLEAMFLNTSIQNQIEQFDLFVPMLDARRMEVYMSIYNKQGEQIAPTTASIIHEEFFNGFEGKKILIFGPGADKLDGTFIKNEHIQTIKNIHPSAKDAASICSLKMSKNQTEDVAYFEPFYLKEFVATTPKKRL
tara:strand:+ start:8022 stop:8705 length:684 start_codon:yes stop_codon:yes gene_type:complete